jgi:hypothetical protein
MKREAAKIKSKKAPGPDGIPPKIVKVTCTSTPDKVRCVLNHALRNVTFPGRWKMARMVPIPKPNKTSTNPDAYRPICMLDGLGKLLEKILVDRIMK